MGANSTRTCLAFFFLRFRQGWWSPPEAWASSTHCKSASLDSWFSEITTTLWMLPEAPWFPRMFTFAETWIENVSLVNGPVLAFSSSPACSSIILFAFPFAVKFFPYDNVLHGENKGSLEWTQLLVLAVKVHCMLYVLSKFFVLRWQFCRKNDMLEGCSQMQGWKNVYSGCCFFPTEWVSFCSGHCAWLPGLHLPFCDGSPLIFSSGPTSPNYNISLTIIFFLLWPWIFRGVM